MPIPFIIAIYVHLFVVSHSLFIRTQYTHEHIFTIIIIEMKFKKKNDKKQRKIKL